jgi:hypothetical protein
VKIPQDERFRAERARHALRFTCEDCAMWDPDRDACAHGYPTREHRLPRYRDAGTDVVFCKDWDLR